MMMRRSSSAPLAATHHGHRRRASDSPPSPLTAPSCASVTLRRHCSCSASSTDSSPSIAAALPPPAQPAASSPTEPSDDLSTPRITFGTFESFVVDASTSTLPGPKPISMDIVVAPPPPSPTPRVTTEDAPVTSPSPPAPPAQTAQQVEEKTEDAPKKALGTGPGTCMVCLEDCEEVIGSTWLHPRPSTSTAAEGGEEGELDGVDECGVTACAVCLKTYFTGIVEAGYDGACPRMRCMSCPRVVCEQSWAPLVEPEVLETFQSRAANLLSIQCGQCDGRGTIMVEPPARHSYSSAIERLMVVVGQSLDRKTTPSVDAEQKTGDGAPATCTTPAATAAIAAATATTATISPATAASAVASIDPALNNDSKADNAADFSPSTAAQLRESFRAELELYASGNRVDASPCYMAFEDALGKLGAQMHVRMLLNCIEDSERKASLHIRFIRSNPMVTTDCCDTDHCFRCRVVDGHYPLTCDQYEAQRGYEGVARCPGCGVYVVKGDGCDAITCICGYEFNWEELVRDRFADVFRHAYPDNTDRLAAEIIRRGEPEDTGTEAGEQAPPAATVGAPAPAAGAAPNSNGLDEATGRSAAGGQAIQVDGETAGIETTNTSPSSQEVAAGLQAPVPATTAADDGAGRSKPEAEERENARGWDLERAEGAEGRNNGTPTQEPVEEPVDGLVSEARVVEATREPTEVEVEREEAVLARNGPLSAQDDFRLASAYAQVYPRKVTLASVEMYGEENPHFTVQWARAQRHRSTWRNLAPAFSAYTGRPNPATSPPSDAEAEWQTTTAANWLAENMGEVAMVERREAAARSSLVEAFYGDASRPSRNTAIAHTAAEHARAALRVATPLEAPGVPAPNTHNPEEDESLFKWLGIVEPPSPPSPPSLAVPADGDGSPPDRSPCDGDETDEDEELDWRLLFTDPAEPAPEVIPPPSYIWKPWPKGALAPSRPSIRGRKAAEDPATRAVSSVATFGSVPMQREVERWIAGADSRQEQLRKLMAVEERELSEAWVALWGRRLRFDPSTKAWVDGSGGDDEAVRSAARRVVFLQGHPEQACREQAAMMKAFVRRNGAAVAEAKKASNAELAAAWEKLHGTEISLPTTATARATATAAEATLSTSMLSHAYDAYLRHVEARTAAALATSPASVATTLDLRRTGRMADAWMWKNRSWVAGRRFADRFVGKDCGDSSAAAVAAVAALVVAPALLRESPLMCDCGVDGVCSDAADWVSFNQAAYDEELERVDRKISSEDGKAGEMGVSRAIEGCECPEREASLSCARLVACPVVTRRVLKVAEPVCTQCEEVEGGFPGGDLLDFFS